MLKHKVFLTQTDTTIGFVSQDAERLTSIKKRPSSKHYIRVLNSLSTLKRFTHVPQMHKKRVRRTKKTTFIMPNGYSFRVIYDKNHLLLINRLIWAYSSSANLSNQDYDEDFAKNSADITINPLHQTKAPSSIYKLGKCRIQKIR